MNLSFLAILAALAVGIPAGYFLNRALNKDDGYYASLLTDFDKSYTQMIANEISGDKMGAHLKYLTSFPHMAGTPGDKKSADYVYGFWKDLNIDHVEMIDYDVFLSFPDDDKFNNIQIRSPTGTETFEIKEPTYDSDLNYTGIPKPYLAFANAGSVTSDEVYYANYCAEEDFLELIKQGINVTGKIVICRYGQIFRGNKMDFAEKYGASGALLYDDPKRIAPVQLQNEVYPNGFYLPGEGVQRGSIKIVRGDPLTPVYPSTPSAYRLDPNDTKALRLPNIPSQVIGYKLAQDIFRLMENNKKASSNWAGEMNVTYTYGGKLSGGKALTLNVFNQRRIAKTYNVLATIKGSTEPDKYVLMGNHRDAWSFGAIDPVSGTATMLEVSRVLMNLKQKKGWMPKRSIMFMSWSSEEQGLTGSVEWVQEFKKKLRANAVAYLNVDMAVEGNFSYSASSSPSLNKLLHDVTKSIKISDTESVYDRWAMNEPSPDPEKRGQPDIWSLLGSGSDFMAFTQYVGVPIIDQEFVRRSSDSKHKSFGLKTHPTYHSSYETYRLMSQFVDPGFFGLKTIATVSAEILRVLTDSLILPIDVVTSANDIKKEFKTFEQKYKATMDNLGISLDQFRESVENLTSVASNFQDKLNNIDKTKYHLVHSYNERLRKYEGAFLDPYGISRHNGNEHMIYAPSLSDGYGSDVFPALANAIYDYNKAKTEENKNKIKLGLSITIYAINSAISILKEPYDFSRTSN